MVRGWLEGYGFMTVGKDDILDLGPGGGLERDRVVGEEFEDWYYICGEVEREESRV